MKKLMGIMTCLLLLSAASGLSEEKKPSIVVKGVYIGMDVQEAAKQIKTKLPEGWELSGPDKDDEGPGGYAITVYLWIGAALPGGVIIADAEGKVTTIKLTTMLVDDMFQAENMEASEFAKKFAESYKIPSLEPKDSWDGWYYTSPEGYNVTVSD